MTWGVLCFLFVCLGSGQLVNPTLDVSGGSVTGWGKSSVVLTQITAGGQVCTNLGDGGGCTQIYQNVDTEVGKRYRFSCFGYSTYRPIGSDKWAHGLLVLSGPWYCPSSSIDPNIAFTNLSFFSPYEVSPSWFLVAVDFTANITSTVVIAHSDGTESACYRNCSLNLLTEAPTQSPSRTPTTSFPTQNPTQVPTQMPTQTPSDAPSQMPSRTPTQAPSRTPTQIPCVECSVPSCQGLSIQKTAADCNTITDLSQVVSWTQSIASAAESRSLICSVFDWEQKTNGCNHPLNRNLFIDVCATLRNAIYSGFISQFNAKWCMNPTTNFSNASSLAQQWNSSLDINYTVATNQAPCLETQKYQTSTDPRSSSYVELGPLADVVAHPEKYPNFPAIKTVSTSRTTRVLFNTACLESTAVAPAWIGLLVAFLAIALVSAGLLFKRRKLLPVRARNPFLLWGGLFWIVLNFIWISIDQLTGNTTSCGLISFGNLVAFPMLLFFYLLRGLRLLFLYKWAEGKVNHKQWIHAHRKLVTLRSFLITSGVFFVLCLIIFMSTNLVDDTFSETFISSGRCDWWDLNQQVIEAASQAGVPLLPTEFNPNGFVPYSVEYSSCVFCSTFGTQVLMCVITVLLLCALIVTLILLRKINDQFKLWFELVVVLIVLCVVAIVRSIMFFPSAAASMMQDVGSDLSALFLASALFPILLISSLYPAILTYTFRFRVVPRPSHTTMDGEMGINGQTVSISLAEVLGDSLGLHMYKQFALESFAVENVTCWIQFKEFEKMPIDDPARPDMAVSFYENFIRQGAVMEVNVEAPLRERYDQMFGVLSDSTGASTPSISASGDAVEATIRHEQQGAIAPREIPADMFADVMKVVFSLMLTNCWVRFKRSPFWGALTEEMQKRAAESNPIASEGGTQMSNFGSMTR